MTNTKNNIVIVTGLSGAGMSSALKSLEDLGYEVLDNIPLFLVAPFLKERGADKRPLAIGIDSRTRDFDPGAVAQSAKELNAALVFITCDGAALQRRFSETRRRHPLAQDRAVIDGIDKERRLLGPLRAAADELIDTSELTIHDLRRIISERFSKEGAHKLSITLMSFGFKYGLPRESDIVQDVRFLKNPHWEADLKKLTGKDKAVGDYIESDENFAAFLENFKKMLEPLLPRYVSEGKSYLTISFGCSGGQHRSVYMVETLKPWLEAQGFAVHLCHRELKD